MQPCRGAEGGCEAAIAHWIFVSNIAIGCVAGGFGHCLAFIPVCCRSASSWTGQLRLGEPCRLLSFREGTGSECCHLIFVWRELADLACFSIAKLEREVHDGKGI